MPTMSNLRSRVLLTLCIVVSIRANDDNADGIVVENETTEVLATEEEDETSTAVSSTTSEEAESDPNAPLIMDEVAPGYVSLGGQQYEQSAREAGVIIHRQKVTGKFECVGTSPSGEYCAKWNSILQVMNDTTLLIDGGRPWYLVDKECVETLSYDDLPGEDHRKHWASAMCEDTESPSGIYTSSNTICDTTVGHPGDFRWSDGFCQCTKESNYEDCSLVNNECYENEIQCGYRNPITNYRCRNMPQNKCCPNIKGAFCSKSTTYEERRGPERQQMQKSTLTCNVEERSPGGRFYTHQICTGDALDTKPGEQALSTEIHIDKRCMVESASGGYCQTWEYNLMRRVPMGLPYVIQKLTGNCTRHHHELYCRKIVWEGWQELYERPAAGEADSDDGSWLFFVIPGGGVLLLCCAFFASKKFLPERHDVDQDEVVGLPRVPGRKVASVQDEHL